MTTTYAYTGTLVVQTCCHEQCGVTYGVPSDFDDRRREDHKSFFCPNGHRQSYVGETAVQCAERLRRDAEAWAESEKAARLAERDQREAAERSLRATKGHLTRQRRRAANGVCPCCSRTFPDLADHIAAKHPAYVEATRPADADGGLA